MPVTFPHFLPGTVACADEGLFDSAIARSFFFFFSQIVALRARRASLNSCKMNGCTHTGLPWVDLGQPSGNRAIF